MTPELLILVLAFALKLVIGNVIYYRKKEKVEREKRIEIQMRTLDLNPNKYQYQLL